MKSLGSSALLFCLILLNLSIPEAKVAFSGHLFPAQLNSFSAKNSAYSGNLEGNLSGDAQHSLPVELAQSNKLIRKLPLISSIRTHSGKLTRPEIMAQLPEVFHFFSLIKDLPVSCRNLRI